MPEPLGVYFLREFDTYEYLKKQGDDYQLKTIYANHMFEKLVTASKDGGTASATQQNIPLDPNGEHNGVFTGFNDYF
jgi:hypothetical protein